MNYPEWIAAYDTRDAGAARSAPPGRYLPGRAAPHLGPDAGLQSRFEISRRSDRIGLRPDLRKLGIVHGRRSFDRQRHFRPFLEEMAKRDSRLKIFFRAENGGIALCSNSALALARGEWCALLDQDDLLAENALAEVVREIARHPEAGLIYSDEDFVDSLGERTNPFFKPDWNPELFLGQNYLNHLGVYRTSLLREIGGFRDRIRRLAGLRSRAALQRPSARGTDSAHPASPLSLADGRPAAWPSSPMQNRTHDTRRGARSTAICRNAELRRGPKPARKMPNRIGSFTSSRRSAERHNSPPAEGADLG